jgi:hypothetical protein
MSDFEDTSGSSSSSARCEDMLLSAAAVGDDHGFVSELGCSYAVG